MKTTFFVGIFLYCIPSVLFANTSLPKQYFKSLKKENHKPFDCGVELIKLDSIIKVKAKAFFSLKKIDSNNFFNANNLIEELRSALDLAEVAYTKYICSEYKNEKIKYSNQLYRLNTIVKSSDNLNKAIYTIYTHLSELAHGESDPYLKEYYLKKIAPDFKIFIKYYNEKKCTLFLQEYIVKSASKS